MERYQDAVDSFTAANETDPGNSAAIAGLAKAQPAAAGSMQTKMIVLIIVLIVAAAGVVWLRQIPQGCRTDATGKEEERKEERIIFWLYRNAQRYTTTLLGATAYDASAPAAVAARKCQKHFLEPAMPLAMAASPTGG